ncbi:hypothetical protein M409DRAFT_17293 [Zasmidium cellare ATCC 36951]|uniref:Uncharacterized protein n=1 Tax=Zasmidium cellare ATCC 36951 TaxID=1080233 RepID=A0A6A6CY79_ZASCE|nr:uncharacterized protein M409DRAFT_17293 [Zasmidium cellare ATCC 36951]KAF2172051.1 hypothetical protein M409DRAFT_17293 [Zasmidium cellare ATCC 36951]
MSNSQPNAWQTTRSSNNNTNTSNRTSASSSRTPQSRSTYASPAPQNPSKPPSSAPGGNVWTQRAAAAAQQTQQPQAPSSSSSINGPDEQHTPLNGFNSAEVKGFLGREAAPAVYKLQEGQGGQRNSGSAWGSKANHMANGQPFFLQLAKQVAAFEGGG